MVLVRWSDTRFLGPVARLALLRMPMDIAQFFYTLVPTPGTPVYIRG